MKGYILRGVIFIALSAIVYGFFNQTAPVYQENYAVAYSDFIDSVRSRGISEVMINGVNIDGRRTNGERFSTYNPNDPRLIDELLEYGVKIKVEKPQVTSEATQILISWTPMLLLIGLAIYFMRKQTGGSGQMGFGKSRAKLMAASVRAEDAASAPRPT